MKTVRKLLVLTGLMALAGGASAQTLTIETVMPNPVVGTPSVAVDVTIDMMGTAHVGVAFNILYDEANLDFMSITCAAGAITCTDLVANDGAVNVGYLSAVTDGVIATVTFDTSASPAMVYNITANPAVYTDPGFVDQPLAVTDGGFTIVLGPMPDITLTPTAAMGLDLGSSVQNFGPNPTGNLTIENTGDPLGANLTGTCTLGNFNPAVGNAISANMDPLNLNLAAGAQSIVAFTCDNTAAVATHTADYDCTGTNAASGDPGPLTVMCDITMPGPGVFGSTPTAPGGTFPINGLPGALPNSGTVTGDLTLQNTAAPGNSDITGLTCTEGAGDANITIQTAPAATLAPGASSAMTLACDTTGAAVGTLSRAISCDYDLDGDMINDGPSMYTAECEIRAADTMTSAPPTGTPLNITVTAPGGSGVTAVNFVETLNEGVAGTLDCAINGVDAGLFSATPAVPFSVPIPSGGTVQVVINGTEPGTAMPVAATLDCTITENSGIMNVVSYPLGFTIQPVSIPTLSQWGMILMTLGLLGFGAYRMRRGRVM